MSSAFDVLSAISGVKLAKSALVADATSTLTKVKAGGHTTKMKYRSDNVSGNYLSSSDNQLPKYIRFMRRQS
jgi:hypothetical protein